MSSTEPCRVTNRSTLDASHIVPPCRPDESCRGPQGELVPQQASVFFPGRVTPQNIGSGRQTGRLERGPNNPIVGRGGSHNRYRDPEEGTTPGTRRGLGDVPTHTPDAVPAHSQFSQRNRCGSALALGRPLGRETRGERRPLRGKKSTQSWSTSVPCGTSLPPRSSSRTESRHVAPPAIFKADQAVSTSATPVRPIGTTLAPNPGACGRAQQRQGFARSARRAVAEPARP